jgi:dimethylargininase
MFKRAIVKKPCQNMVLGLTEAKLGLPDFENATIQHQKYVDALMQCGLDVTVLDSDNQFPDSTFVEDTALLTPHCAIIMNPGALSRKEEVISMTETIKQFYKNIEYVKSPGTADAGDIMMVGKHFYIGLSGRTNAEGANQIIIILQKHGLDGSTVSLKEVLHLKTGVSYLENNNLVASGEFITKPEFQKFNLLKVSADESSAANCVWINDFVLIAKGFPKTKQTIENAGYKTIEVDVSEFRKLDGGLSCLSLRF